MCRSELKADKSTALKWLAYDKAFKPIDNDKTYAQALTQTKSNKCYDVQPLRAAIAKPNKQFLPTAKVHRKYQSKLYHNKASLANNGRGPGTNIRSGDLQTSKVIFRENKVGVTVAGASPCRAPVLLKNRFYPLQAFLSDDYNDESSQDSFQITERAQGHRKHTYSIENAVNVSKTQPKFTPLVATQKNNPLAGKKKKIGSFDRGNSVGGVVENHSKSANVCQTVPPGICSIHKTIDQTVLDRNLKPQYTGPITESCYENENDKVVHTDRKSDFSQNFHTFGFVPKAPLQLYTGEVVHWQNIPSIIEAHYLVKSSKMPSYMKCRIPVQSGLNIRAWRSRLSNYWDQQLCDLLEFGFPLDFDRNCHLISAESNHASAVQNSQHISQFIQEELDHNAMLGPFDSKLIDMHISPLLVRDKQNSSSKRTIMDLSWPKGASVNDGVMKNIYLGTEYDLSYPSVDTITDSLRKLGTSAQMYKIDISRAFRQIKIDPADIDLLGLQFQDQYFLDQSVAFGFRHGSLIFQRCMDAIRHIMKENGFPHLFNYIDDLIYTGLPSDIHSSFQFLKDLLLELGLDISVKKLVPPSTSVVCLGILVDSLTRTVAIPIDKLSEIRQLCLDWTLKTYCSKQKLQSLLGSLLYVTRCVKYSRFFLNRMLQLLRDNVHNNKILITSNFRKDLAWFNQFLSHYNGVTYYDNKYCHEEVHLDACLSGLGASFQSMVYALPIPKNYNNYNIVHLELLNIVVALKVWAAYWTNKKIKIHCDNMAVVEVLQKGRARDATLALLARNVWLICALFNIQILACHIPGKDNILADLLSRWQFSEANYEQLLHIIPTPNWVPTHLDLTLLNYQI